ncbi:PREDICTED: protein FAR1-RELATED SEQUENCE 5-like [Erythranthe guttata]|uniref:protein FAR1-RELATED SEQUENCE 5-like n=1 Tax=Erythranthe guttata TaxID=4155 RepID=UPI00064DE4DA|nr:PREDICTED: protein FAR1-RELATED SEQUENCE 5-like [Erythranthe guttata]|eukprot:XP_012853799.1 PREDICTED: protein FAR1-RELATED SEQUENCE 5-like [Erythranthe guttata]
MSNFDESDYNGGDELENNSGAELEHNNGEKDSTSSTWAEESVSTSNREENNGDTDDESGIILNRVWVCCREGHRKERIDESDRLRGHRPETRCGCHALFRVALNRSTGRYTMTAFEPKHNHNQLHLNVLLHVCWKIGYKILTSATKIMLDTMTHVGCKPSLVLDLLEHLGGGSATGVLNRNDAYNYLKGDRLKRIESGDVNTLLGLLDGMKLKDKTLEYKHGIDQGGALTGILLERRTYKTNICCFPVVLFSGVNFHLCTRFFGVAIMYKETTQQYTWLMQTLLEFMGGKPPKAVFTEQDGAMRAAIRIVFPEAAHRLCCWDISRNVESNIKKPGRFSTEFSNLMNMPCSVPEFEDRWSALIAKFGLTDDPYLADLYEKRSFLNRIRKRFDELQRESEVQPKISGKGLVGCVEGHAARICTRAILKLVRVQLKEDANIIIIRRSDIVGHRHTFNFEDHNFDPTDDLTVVVDLDKEEFLCDCKMLESDGIPCRHLICCFKHLKLNQFPAKSINSRWFVDVGKRLTSAFSYQQTDNLYTSGRVKMREDEIELNITPTDEDDESCSQLHSDGEDTIHNVKCPRNVADPCKIVSKGGSIRKKQLCSFCRKPGKKTTTCELNPKAGFSSRGKVNSKQSASRSDNVGSRSYVPQFSPMSSEHSLADMNVMSHSNIPYNMLHQRSQYQDGSNDDNSYLTPAFVESVYPMRPP